MRASSRTTSADTTRPRHRASAPCSRTGSSEPCWSPATAPLLSPADLDALLTHPTGERSALIVPDRHGTGTNALLLTPPDVLAPSFGPDSRRRHLADASAAGVPAEVVELESLALDVDTLDDLEALRRALGTTHGGAAHTRGMLNQLMRSRA